jgi:hypothetical protein
MEVCINNHGSSSSPANRLLFSTSQIPPFALRLVFVLTAFSHDARQDHSIRLDETLQCVSSIGVQLCRANVEMS